MKKTYQAVLLACAVMTSSCTIMPEKLGGYRCCDISIRNYDDPTAPAVELRLRSSGDEHSERGIVALRIEEIRDARAHFEKAVEASERKDTNALFLLAVVHEKLGGAEDLRMARKLYLEAIALETCDVYEASYRRVKESE